MISHVTEAMSSIGDHQKEEMMKKGKDIETWAQSFTDWTLIKASSTALRLEPANTDLSVAPTRTYSATPED